MFGSKDLTGTYWYCLDHHRAELFEDCKSHNRMGPYASMDEASRALQTAREREEKYDAEDAAWNGDE
jgi:hypothetical protein